MCPSPDDAIPSARRAPAVRRSTGRATLRRSLALGAVLVAIAMPAVGGAAPRAVRAPVATSLVVRVRGEHLFNAHGAVLRLLGVDRSGSEYECMASNEVFDGPSDAASVDAIVAWHANAVRIPLNEDCWLGIDGARTSATEYRMAIEAYVDLLEAHGLYAILDLHWAAPGRWRATSQWPMPDASHAVSFWRSMGRTFKGNRGVLFDLFNEPYDTSWPCWRDGCVLTHDDGATPVRYRAAGMQQLVDAVRSTGADTPLLLGGLHWSSDESGWLAYEPHDPDHQLVVSFHTYNFSDCSSLACWDATIAPLAKHVPVVTGEFGESGCTDVYALRYMAWADAHGVSYLGWAWDSSGPPSYWGCSSGPALIASYGGAPTRYGQGLRHHLAQLAARARHR